MTYGQALKYLDSFVDYEKISSYSYDKAFGLARIKKLLEFLGNPHKDLKVLHIAGTKGKGSTSAFAAYILREAGFKTGLYTSPHLEDFRERIRILKPKIHKPKPKTDFEGMISRNDLARLVERIRPHTERFKKELKYGVLSFFEAYTALAFLYFKQKRVDFTVLETGMGGRLDATNVAEPLVCAITPLSYEHTQRLGNTLEEIATEKAGIIKTQSVKRKAQNKKQEKKRLIVITAPQEKEALEIIKKRCRAVGAKLHRPKIDKSLKPRLLGGHQMINASVAKAAVEALRLNIGPDVIKRGIRNTVWPGRCEIAARYPLVVLDGAQNVASMQALKKAVKEEFKYKRLILVLGVSGDKDIKGISRELYDFADEIILTRSRNPRAAEPAELAGHFGDKNIYITVGVKEAKARAHNTAKPQDLILFTGSLFMVGEARRLYEKHKFI